MYIYLQHHDVVGKNEIFTLVHHLQITFGHGSVVYERTVTVSRAGMPDCSIPRPSSCYHSQVKKGQNGKNHPINHSVREHKIDM